MLPHFFRHYDDIVDEYFINDNHSTDASVRILSSHPRVSLSHFEVTGNSFVEFARQHYNECWKASRGHADWVIVCNIDEHVYHLNLKQYLSDCRQAGVTLLVPEGYNMVSETFPTSGVPLYLAVPDGMPEPRMHKPQIFNPNAINEINFGPGRHKANPVGNVVIEKAKLKLLHFKYLGLEYLLPRQEDLRKGLKAGDIEKGWGSHYHQDDEQKREEFQRKKNLCVKVLCKRERMSAQVLALWKKLKVGRSLKLEEA